MRRLLAAELALLVAAAGPAGAGEPPKPAPATESVPASEPAPATTSPPAPSPAPTPAPAPGRYHVFAGELAAGGVISSLADLKLTGWEIRLGLGGRQGSEATSAVHLSAFESATWLITAGISRSQTPAGLEARGLRLGLGARVHGGRFTMGAGAEWIQLEVLRVSTVGRLLAQGIGVSLLGDFDLFHFVGDRAVMAYVEGTLDSYGNTLETGTHNTQFGLHGGVALRW